MKRNFRSAVLASTAGLLVAASAAVVVADEKEEKVELSALPAAVRSTAEANAEGGTLTEAEVETENGQQVYEIEVRKADGQELELEIAADGKLLEVERDDDDADAEEQEEKIALAQAPAAVQAALNQLLGDDATSVVLTREKEHGAEVFEAEYVVGGVSHEIELAANGAILEQETTVNPSALPAEVAAGIQKKFPGARIAEAEEVVVRFYELEITVDGKKREVKVSPEGRVLGGDDGDDDDD